MLSKQPAMSGSSNRPVATASTRSMLAVLAPHLPCHRASRVGTELRFLQHGEHGVGLTVIQELADVVTQHVVHRPTQQLLDRPALERHPSVAIEHGDEVGRFRDQRIEPSCAFEERRGVLLSGGEEAAGPFGAPDHQREAEATDDQGQDGALDPPQPGVVRALLEEGPLGIEIPLEDIERRNELEGADVGGHRGEPGSPERQPPVRGIQVHREVVPRRSAHRANRWTPWLARIA